MIIYCSFLYLVQVRVKHHLITCLRFIHNRCMWTLSQVNVLGNFQRTFYNVQPLNNECREGLFIAAVIPSRSSITVQKKGYHTFNTRPRRGPREKRIFHSRHPGCRTAKSPRLAGPVYCFRDKCCHWDGRPNRTGLERRRGRRNRTRVITGQRFRVVRGESMQRIP